MSGQPKFPVSALFITRMRTLRQTHGWSTRELADRILATGGTTNGPTLRNLESRNHHIGLDQAFEIAQALGAPLDAMCSDPQCGECLDCPPPGFTCNSCGMITRAGAAPDSPEPAGRVAGAEPGPGLFWADLNAELRDPGVAAEFAANQERIRAVDAARNAVAQTSDPGDTAEST